MKSRIPYTKPSITNHEVMYATDAVKNGWGSECYAYLHRFEEAFKQYLGSKFAIATSSCTGALHMGMAALDIGPGDEVILADTNWIATAAPIANLGATPIFVDILQDSWCLDPEKVVASITNKTKAIIATHLYGNLCDMGHLLAIGKKFNIPIIEDAAEAIGSTYQGKRAGSMGKFGVFSFHGTKTLTTGEGGMFVTDDPDLFEKVLTLSNHGRARNQHKQFWPDIIGFKYKMSNVQAAIGYGQIQRIDELVNRKREIMNFYRTNLTKFDGVYINPEPSGTVNGSWMPTVVFDETTGITREALQSGFAAENTDARVFFWPLSGLPMFNPIKSNINSWSIPNRAINLPSFHDITHDELNRIINVIKNLING